MIDKHTKENVCAKSGSKGSTIVSSCIALKTQSLFDHTCFWGRVQPLIHHTCCWRFHCCFITHDTEISLHHPEARALFHRSWCWRLNHCFSTQSWRISHCFITHGAEYSTIASQGVEVLTIVSLHLAQKVQLKFCDKMKKVSKFEEPITHCTFKKTNISCCRPSYDLLHCFNEWVQTNAPLLHNSGSPKTLSASSGLYCLQQYFFSFPQKNAWKSLSVICSVCRCGMLECAIWNVLNNLPGCTMNAYHKWSGHTSLYHKVRG